MIKHILNIVCTLVIAMTCGTSQTPFTCKGQYYLSLTKSGSSSSGLYEVKISTDGKKIYLDTISSSIGLVLNGMGYRITDNFIYGIDPNSAHLRKIGSDGVAIDLGIPKGIPKDRLYYAGDVTPDGRYLLLIGLGGTSPQIVKVDLDHPEYECTFVAMQNNSVGIVDIAFDPFTGIMYGHDLRNKRLVIINPDTGAVNADFLVQPQVDQLGAIFFDSFGNLFGYGAYGNYDQDKFVSINKKSGKITLLAQGPLSTGQDGCACPYTLELQKLVTPEIAYPCTDVVYSMIVSNGSGTTRYGIELTDVMPGGFQIKSVLVNPFGGKVQVNGHIIQIKEMIVPVGVDTLKILVEISDDALGLYKNQAVLSGLPPALGSLTYSDDPFTFIEKDSTVLQVLPLDLSFINETYQTCFHDSVLVDARLHGITYLWSDGDTSPQKWLESPGSYSLTARSNCDTKIVNIEVTNDLLSAYVEEDTIYLDLGEDIVISGVLTHQVDPVKVLWTAINNPPTACMDCLSTTAQPINDGYYIFAVINEMGCIVSDTVHVRVKKNRSIFAPNIFSANSDGVNDHFYLSGNALSGQGEYLRIYDRWGNLVFEHTNYELNDDTYGWDGTFLGRHAENGVYTWTASIVYLDGYVQQLSGDVTVLR